MWKDLKEVLKVYQNIYNKYLSFLMKPLFIIILFLIIVKFLTMIVGFSQSYLITLFKIILPFGLGYGISFFLEPVNQFIINKTRVSRKVVAPLTLLGLLSVSFFVISFLLYYLYLQLIRMIDIIINYFKGLDYSNITLQVQSYIDNSFISSYLTDENIEKYATKIEDNLSTILEHSTNFITEAGANITSFTGNLLINTIPSLLIIFFISLLTTFFITKDYDKIGKYLEKSLPDNMYNSLLRVKQEVMKNIVNYAKGQFSLVSVSGLIFFVGFIILDSPYALVFALLCMVLDIIPIIGTILFIVPYIIYALFTGDMFTVYVLAISYVVATVVRQIIEPKIMGSSLGIHPLLFIASLYIGGLTLGAFGIVFGPLVLITVKILIDAEIIENPLKLKKS